MEMDRKEKPSWPSGVIDGHNTQASRRGKGKATPFHQLFFFFSCLVCFMECFNLKFFLVEGSKLDLWRTRSLYFLVLIESRISIHILVYGVFACNGFFYPTFFFSFFDWEGGVSQLFNVSTHLQELVSLVLMDQEVYRETFEIYVRSETMWLTR